MGSLNCDFYDLGISRIERGRESGFNGTRCVPTTLYPFLRFCVIRNKLTFLWELLYPIKIPCWGALLGPV